MLDNSLMTKLITIYFLDFDALTFFQYVRFYYLKRIFWIKESALKFLF